MKISAIILASNCQDIIEPCLKSLAWVDEKILVNLDSEDRTLEIAKKYGCRVIKGGEKYDFSRWRNQGAKAAKGEWLLYVDTDERVSDLLRQEISSKVNQLDAFYIPRKNYFLGKEFRSEWPDYQLRLIKKSALIKWQGKIHEIPKVKGKIGKLKNPLIHLSHRSLESSIANTLNWSRLEAENRLKAGHPPMTGWRFLRILLTGFWQQFIRKGLWREGTEGVIEGIYQMFSLFFTYVRLWEMQRRESLKESYKRIDREFQR
jgi:glycosyltransferase involved in cell wall biosynthesis